MQLAIKEIMLVHWPRVEASTLQEMLYSPFPGCTSFRTTPNVSLSFLGYMHLRSGQFIPCT